MGFQPNVSRVFSHAWRFFFWSRQVRLLADGFRRASLLIAVAPLFRVRRAAGMAAIAGHFSLSLSLTEFCLTEFQRISR